MASDTTATLDRLQRQGWQARKTNGGHLALRGPEGQLVHTSSTPSDTRTISNLEAQLRRAGFEENRPDERRTQRLARGNTKQAQVLAALQDYPGEVFDASSLAVKTGLEHRQVSMALFWLKQNHPEVHQPKRGSYCYTPAVEVPPEQPPSARTPGVWCLCGKWFRTEGYWEEHSRKKQGSGHEEMLTKMPATAGLFTNGNRRKPDPSSEALAVVTEIRDRPVQVAVQAEPRPIKVVPSALPQDLPAMFEAVSTDRQGNLVLRDENGDHWLAVPMRPVLT